MSTNKSSVEYAHDIDIWWGEADSPQNKYFSDSGEEMKSNASSNFLNKFTVLLDFLSMQSIVTAIVRPMQ